MRRYFLFITYFVISLSFYKSQNYTIKQIDSLIGYAVDFSRKAPNNAVPLNEKNYKIAEEANYPEGEVISLNLLAVSHLNMNNLDEALYYAQKAEEKASEINDYKGMCKGLLTYAMINSLLGFDEDAQVAIKNVFSIADKIKDPDDFYEVRGNIYCIKIDMLAYTNKSVTSPSEVFEFAKKSINEFSKIKKIKKRNQFLALANSNLGYAYNKKKMYDSAFYYANKSLELARKDRSTYHECVALNTLIAALKGKKDYQQAISYLELLIPLSKKINEKFMLISSYRGAGKAYEAIGNEEKKLEYFAKYAKLNDSLVKVTNLKNDIAVQKLVKEKEKKYVDEKKDLYLLITVICLFSFLVFYFGYLVFRNYKREKKEKQYKENIIQEKESQLTDLKEKINNAFEEVLELAKKNDPTFLIRFSQVYPDFMRKLNLAYPDLTPGQLKFCALLKLNFSTKDIADYTNISVRSVEIKKGRLRKQLNIASSEDLNKWMNLLD
ncbi:tetratricopeptide repeat protein [Chryseobacterium sp. IT-36CA2]|uniref:tetratricopeptide repeat protein n=1 Tax=Chryseobacterium sp. IT-36CA2 TaxID=3026460 RepID=UPI0039E09BF7